MYLHDATHAIYQQVQALDDTYRQLELEARKAVAAIVVKALQHKQTLTDVVVHMTERLATAKALSASTS